MSITIKELLPRNPAEDVTGVMTVYVDIEHYDDPTLMLKQGDDWISLDPVQQSELYELLKERVC